MASIVKERMNFRKTGYASDEFCDQPMAQVDPQPPPGTVRYWGKLISATYR
jgi:hypothetical protein